jgi:hypothetical protein
MAEQPSSIRARVTERREEAGQAAEELARRANIPARAREVVSAGKERVDRMSSGMPSGSGDGGGGANPYVVAVASVAAGFLAGMAIPETRMESERLGEASSEMRQAAGEVLQEATERGREVLTESAGQAGEAAKQAASELGQHASERMQEAGTTAAGQVRDQVPGATR